MNIQSEVKNTKKYTLSKEWLLAIICAIFLATIINKLLAFTVLIPSPSMVPTLNIEDRLLVLRKDADNLNSGDIVVFYSQEFSERFIKRLIGMPGDHIEIKNGVVYRNGTELNEDYVKNIDTSYNGTFDVPSDKYFFLGDNRSNSKDSRYWKNPYVDKSDIEGTAIFKYYPFSDIGTLKK